MITVAICDDNIKERQMLQQYIENYENKEGIQFIFYHYSSGEEMSKGLEDKSFDIIFLDIYMEKMTGIDVAQKIRENNDRSLIVFTTSSKDYALQAYDLRAFQYLVKPMNKEKINKVLKEIIQYFKCNTNLEVILPTVEGMRKVKIDEIYFIESNIRKTTIHFEQEVCVCTYNINTLESKLKDYGFIRCHRSFIINIRKVELIKQNEIELNNKEVVFLSKYKQKDVKKQLVDYLGGVI